MKSSEQSSLTDKTQFGINAERKLVTAKSIDGMETITGIHREEMFGTAEKGERVLIVGAPEQAKNVADEKRFTYLDYEFAEVANFIDSYEKLIPAIGSPLYEYDYNRRSAQENMTELGFLENGVLKGDFEGNIPYYEGLWCAEVYQVGIEIMDDVISLVPERKNEKDSRSSADILKNLNQNLSRLEEKLKDREENDRENIKARKAIDQDNSGYDVWFSGHHPIEELHINMRSFLSKTRQGLKDIDDFDSLVSPGLTEYKQKITSENEEMDEAEIARLVTKERLSLLNHLRLQKKTAEAGVVAGMFPDLPFANGSFDRLVFSYSISTHVIAEMTAGEFKLWWEEIQRVLTKNGKAYIFPMQQGFPYNRGYDQDACFDTLDKFSPENGGNLTYQLKENYHGKNGGDEYLEETLMIEKV